MVRITIARVPLGYTFYINGLQDASYDPQWGPTTFATPESAARAAEEIVRALEAAGTGDGGGP